MTSLIASLLFGITHASAGETILQIGTTRTSDKFPDLEYVNTTLLRLDVSWIEVEPEDSIFDWNGRLNQIVELGELYGFEVVPVIRTGRCWATGYPIPPQRQAPSCPPEDFSTEWHPDWGYSATYYNLISTLVGHYSDHFTSIIIENEVNGLGMWDGSAKQYIKLLATAYKAAHDAKPDIEVFTDGTSSCVWGFLIAREMLDSGEYSPEEILEFFADYFRKHPDYTFPTPEDFIDFLENNQSFLRHKEFVEYELSHLQNIMDGFNFHYAEPYWLMKEVKSYFTRIFEENNVDVDKLILDELTERFINEPLTPDEEEEYAGLLIKNITEALHIGCTQVYWFPFSEKDLEHNKFGILDQNNNHRIATESFKFLNETFNRKYKSMVRDTVQNTFLVRNSFQAVPSLKYDFDLLWWDDGSHAEGADSVVIDFPEFADSVSCFDYSGNELSIEVSDRKIGIRIDEQPVFMFWYALSEIADPEETPTNSIITLGHNRPNPFNPKTIIPFSVAESTDDLVLSLYNVQGALVKSLVEGVFTSGQYSVTWDGTNNAGMPVSSGVYVCRLTSSLQTPLTRNLLLIR